MRKSLPFNFQVGISLSKGPKPGVNELKCKYEFQTKWKSVESKGAFSRLSLDLTFTMEVETIEESKMFRK
jgi:hypothetical protein